VSGPAGTELGDSELAAPVIGDAPPAGAPATRPGGRDAAGADEFGDDEVVPSSTQSRPSLAVLLLGGILVAALANLVMAWFLLGATTQVRDQHVAANGLQRCLIRAQLAENSGADPGGAAYKAAVQACISR